MPRLKQRIKGVRELKKKIRVTEEKQAASATQPSPQTLSFVRPQMIHPGRPRLRRLEEALPDAPSQAKPSSTERPRTDEPSPSTPFSYETSKGGDTANGLYRIPGAPGTSPGQGYQTGNTTNQAGGQTYQSGRETPTSSEQSFRRTPDTTRQDPFKPASPFDTQKDNRYETTERKYDTTPQKDKDKKQRVL